MEKYEYIKKLGSGNFGVINLMRHKETGDLVAVKQLPRGPKVDKNVYREVINHRKLSHPNIIGFNSVHIDAKFLYIIMEYGAGAHQYTLVHALHNDAAHSVFYRTICTGAATHQCSCKA
jgi:serine/threonine-protein kinase SRK2